MGGWLLLGLGLVYLVGIISTLGGFWGEWVTEGDLAALLGAAVFWPVVLIVFTPFLCVNRMQNMLRERRLNGMEGDPHAKRISLALKRGIERGRCTDNRWDDEQWLADELDKLVGRNRAIH